MIFLIYSSKLDQAISSIANNYNLSPWIYSLFFIALQYIDPFPVFNSAINPKAVPTAQ
jgi:hypothetical protein